MPYFFISYLHLELEYCRDILLKVSFGITTLELATVTILSLTGIQDSHESLYIVHAGLAIHIIMALLTVFDNYIYCKKNRLKYNMIPLFSSLFIFMLSIFWDITNFYLRYRMRDNYVIMRIGILFGILVLTIDSMRKLFEGIKATELTNKVSEITYTDALTGIANRNAYEIKEKELQEKIDSGEITELLICKFDINDLRKVNDNYGHAYGDRHIIKCAEIINKAFGNSGSAFRVGGDEFTVFVIGDGTEYIYERGILKLRELEREYNRTSDQLIQLHIAYGHAVYDREEFETLEKAEIEADKRMYEFKDRMKKGAIV